jgi:crotonobetainyl-CoA:carnitine CoA-transferase CaiB-like acyl-CoA transferase
VNRRELLQSGVGAVALAAAMPRPASAANADAPFSIDAAFADFMKEIGGSASDAGGSVTFTGADPIVRSHFRIGSCMAIASMSAAVGAAAIWRERKGEAQDLSVDLRESVYNVNPLVGIILRKQQQAGMIPPYDPLPSNFNFLHPTVNGLFLQAPIGLGNPMTFAAFETKDGRYFNVTGVYPHLSERALQALNVPPGRDNIVRGFKQVNAFEFEDELNKFGGAGVTHRTREEWLQHPEGKYLAGKPLIEIVKIGDSAPERWAANPAQPLSGVRVLSNTHVIAGTTASRTLAEYGAEVLHVARDQAFEHEAFVIEVNAGMRSTFVDLRDAEQNKRAKGLAQRADVFVENYRGSLSRLGFGPDELANVRPGIVYLSIGAYSWDGPWADRGGFDMEGLATSGFTLEEGNGVPRFPPTLVMNDFIAGYLGAAGVAAALRRRAKEGGSYHVRVSLARAAMWYASLGRFPSTDFDAMAPEHKMIDPELLVRQTPYGEVKRLAPQVKLSKTPSRWRDPLVAVRGADLPVWES